MIALLIIIVLIEFAFFLRKSYLYCKLESELDESKESEAYYKRIVDGFHDKMKEEEEKYELIHAEYYTSYSDILKYNSDKKLRRAVRSKLAMLIGNDIARRFEPSVLPLGEGKEKHSLLLKMKKI